MKRKVSIFAILLFLLFAIGAVKTRVQAQTVPPAVPEPVKEIKLDCQACHGANKMLPYMGGSFFHKDAHEAYSHGFHAQALKNGGKAASCLDCHATGGDMSTILPKTDGRSTINRANIAKTCGSCHSSKSVMEGTGISNRPFLAY